MMFYLLVGFSLFTGRTWIVVVSPAVVIVALTATSFLDTVALEFLFGTVIAGIFQKIRIKPVVAALSALTGITLFAATGVGFLNPSLYQTFWMFASVLIVFGAVYLPPILTGKFILTLGAASYAVYLLHGLTYPLVNFAFTQLFASDGIWVVSTCVLTSVFVAQVVGILFERYIDAPLRRRLSSIGF